MKQNPFLTVFPDGHRLAGRPAWSLDGRLVPVVSGGDGPTAATTVLDGLYAKRQKVVDEWTAAVDKRETERTTFESRSEGDDKPSEAELQVFKDAEAGFLASNDQYKAKIAEYDARIADQLETQRLRDEATAAHRGVVTEGDLTEPLLYTRQAGRGENGISYYRDLAAAFVPGVTFQATDQAQSLQRLRRHAEQMDVEMPKRAKSRERRALARVNEAEQGELRTNPFVKGNAEVTKVDRGWANPFEYRVEPNLATGQGGYFSPPLWLPDEYIPQLVAHLVAAGLCRQMDLPPGTDSINIPKVSGGTAVGYQQANNSGVVTQDWTDTSVQANVKTIAGDSDVALQLLEQSPHGLVDEVITMNLMQQYNKFLDQQVVAGDGLNTGQLNGGHLNGLYPATNWSGTSTVTYTTGAPAPWHFISVMAAMMSNIAENRFDLSQLKYVLHGRRFGWYVGGVDANDRPLVNSSDGSPYNVPMVFDSPLPAEGLAGRTNFGAPIYVDDNVPTADTTGGGSGQDVAIAANWDDIWLFQGELRTNVYREVLSGSLGVRFQVYNYAAFLLRYGQSLAIASGSGFAAPTGAVSSITY